MADKIQSGQEKIKSGRYLNNFAKIQSIQVKSPIIAQPGPLFKLSKLTLCCFSNMQSGNNCFCTVQTKWILSTSKSVQEEYKCLDENII